MTNPQEQYMEFLRNGQHAVVEAMEAWTKIARKAFGASGAGNACGRRPRSSPAGAAHAARRQRPHAYNATIRTGHSAWTIADLARDPSRGCKGTWWLWRPTTRSSDSPDSRVRRSAGHS
jgi:hypothetical protein